MPVLLCNKWVQHACPQQATWSVYKLVDSANINQVTYWGRGVQPHSDLHVSQ